MVLLCSGRYAKNPYYGNVEGIMLYSVEELCYYIYHNAYLLDDSFFDENLFSFIEQELDLKELADVLRQVSGKENSFIECIEVLIRNTGYYEREELEELKQTLGENVNMSVLEKRKIRADLYLNKKKYAVAADEYEILLKDVDPADKRMRAKLYHNLGVCATGKFMFQKAADYFKCAYDTYANTESYVQYLTALKLGSTNTDYLNFLSEHPESYEDSLEVENRMKHANRKWQDDENHVMLNKMLQEDSKSEGYYEALEEFIESQKREYRDMVTDRQY